MERSVASENGKFVVMADVELKKESVEDFKKWFVESNKVISKFDGFIARRLLVSQDGKHGIMVAFRDGDSFLQMLQSQEHAELHAQAVTFMTRPPAPTFYSVAAE
jgi:heme-degrading monooxygenase HmoA